MKDLYTKQQKYLWKELNNEIKEIPSSTHMIKINPVRNKKPENYIIAEEIESVTEKNFLTEFYQVFKEELL